MREAQLDRIRCQADVSDTSEIKVKSIGRIAFAKLGRASIAFRIVLDGPNLGSTYLDEVALLEPGP